MASLNRKWSSARQSGGVGMSSEAINPEEFWNAQITAVSKALAGVECAAKEKHIRSCFSTILYITITTHADVILGTHIEKGCGTFWSCIHRIQIESNRFTSWKFCYLLHKLMRDGHSSVLVHSMKYKTKIGELGKLWYHLKSDVYGPLIFQYTKLIDIKLKFHKNNRSIPGNLALSDAQIASLGERDVNNWFELAIEMLDYMDEILALQSLVFNSMDMSRANSLTHSGQCRLQPLIPCILDSSLLYDYLVKMMFKLHGVLPTDTLSGHRERFNKQFTQLKKFYQTSSNLQYFKYLVQIPNISNSPPNFFVAGEFDSYVSDHAISLDAPSEGGSDGEGASTGTLLDLDFDSNAAASPVAAVNDKDQIVNSLQQDLEDARQFVVKFRAEGQRAIEQYKNHISQLEYELQAAKEAADNAQEENKRLKGQTELLKNEAIQQAETSKATAAQEEKFKKMKDMYMKIREEHINTLKKLGDLQKEAATLRTEYSQMAKKCANMTTELTQRTEKCDDAVKALAEAEQSYIASLCSACVTSLKDACEQLDSPAFLGVTCPPEHAHSRLLPLRHTVHSRLRTATDAYRDSTSNNDKRAQSLEFAAALVDECCRMTDAILLSAAVAHMAPDNKSSEIDEAVRALSRDAIQLFGTLAVRSTGQDASTAAFDRVDSDLEQLCNHMIAPMQSDIDKLGSLIESEMRAMDEAIQAAAERIRTIVDRSRQQDTGIRLEVNASILEACTSLMQAVQELVKKSRDLQNEIVAQGRGSGSVHEFYKKNHQWTEGLLSAAKAIAGAAKVLVDSADRVIDGTGKFEELMVASREVAASTAQLFIASKIKADRDSPRLTAVTGASRQVTQCTANVIGAVKSGQQSLDEQSVTLDFASMSMHQAKQAEFDAQVRVLELESEIARERQRLGQLRQRNYKEDTP